MKLIHRALLAGIVAAAYAIPASANGLYLAPLSKWKDGKIVWYYNPAHTPAGMTHDYVVDSIKESFAEWTKGCRISAEYGGETSVPADPNAFAETGQVTIGFFPFVNDAAAGRGGLLNPSGAGNATAGIVALNTVRPDGAVMEHLAPGDAFKQVLTHEIGHLLGLGHTLNPYAVMYGQTTAGINAWNPLPFGEDLTTCANLYGSNGVVDRPYYGGDFAADPSYGVTVQMETAMPDAQNPQSPPVTLFDLSKPATPYKVIRWNRQGGPIDIQWRLVAPGGANLVNPAFYALTPDHQASLLHGGLFWMTSTMPTGQHESSPFLPALNGRWRLQAFANGNPAAEFLFDTVNGGIAPDERHLEMALIVEASGDRYAVRTRHFDQVGLSSYDVYLNGDHSQSVPSFTKPSGASVIELWAKSDLARPSQCIPQDTPDVVRYLPFLSGGGKFADNRIVVTESGTLAAYSARADIETGQSGPQDVFVVADVGGQVLYRQANGSWGTAEHAMFSFQAPGAASFDVARNINSYELPAGARVHVAYGMSYADAVARNQVALVRAFGDAHGDAAAVIAGSRDAYTVAVEGDSVTVTRSTDRYVQAFSVAQEVTFSDRRVSFDTAGVAGQAYRIYQAAFNRAPDAVGLGFWIQRMQSGVPLDRVAAEFQASPEFKAMYGTSVSNEAWVRLVYQNVLRRSPDDAGLQYWVQQLDKGLDRATALVGFSESVENKDNLAGAVVNGIEYKPYGG